MNTQRFCSLLALLFFVSPASGTEYYVLNADDFSKSYSNRALARGLTGDVLVEFTLTKFGSVRDAIIVESTSKVFETRTLQTVKKLHFSPPLKSGTPKEVRYVRIIVFYTATGVVIGNATTQDSDESNMQNEIKPAE